LDTANWSFQRNWGNDQGNVTFFIGLLWKLSFESTRVEAAAGVYCSLLGNQFRILDAGAYLGTTGYTSFLAQLYLIFNIPNPFLGSTITYAAFNWAIHYGYPLPIRENVDICQPMDLNSDSPLIWKGQLLLPVFTLFKFEVRFFVFLKASVVVTAKMFVNYNYELVFSKGLTTDVSQMQIRLAVMPGGEVTANLIASADAIAVEVGVSTNLQVARISIPSNWGIRLNGFSTCQYQNLQLDMLRGDFTVFYLNRLFCFFSKGPLCAGSYTLGDWPGFPYYTDLSKTSCCEPPVSDPVPGGSGIGDGGAGAGGPTPGGGTGVGDGGAGAGGADPVPGGGSAGGGSNPSRTAAHARNPLPAGSIPAGQSSRTFNINNGLTSITWESVNGVERPTMAISFIGGCTVANGCPNGVPTNVHSSVSTALRGTGEYITPQFNAGHILAATLGGSNDDIRNFFIQDAAQNQNEWANGFERQLRNCLQTNPAYWASITVAFEYDGPKQYTPSNYAATAEFTYQNGTACPTNANDNSPLGCTWTPTAHFAFGEMNLYYNAIANY